MATRMTTLAYIEKEPFTYGNRPDAEVDPGDSGEHPRLLPTIEMRTYERAAEEHEPFPRSPSAPSLEAVAGPPVALPSMFLGLAIGAAVLVGLALFGIVVAWAATLSTIATIALLGSAVYLLGAGITVLIASPTFRFA